MSALLIATGIVLFFILIAAADWERDKKRAAERQRRYNENNISTQKANTMSNSSNSRAVNDVPRASIYNTSITPQYMADNIDALCRWEQQEDKWHYVVISEKLQGKYIEISSNLWGYFNEKPVDFGKVVGHIKVQLFTEQFVWADIDVTAPIAGVLFFHKQSEYSVRDVIATIDTAPDVIAKYEAIEQQKKEILRLRRIAEVEHEAERERMRLIQIEADRIDAERRQEEYVIRLAKEKMEREQAERDEIAAKIKERHRLRQLEKEVEMELIEKGEILKDARRPPIPRDVRDAVYNRDGGRCVECGSTDNLHFDHIIPFSKGGATNVENLQILCQKCNLAKSNKIG